MITFRIAKVEDASRILEIYAYYVENTAVSYEYDVPSIAEFTERVRSTLVKYPYIVAEEDGRIVGYIYASRFAQRAAYGWAAGTSIYIDRDFHRRGIGKLLYEKLEAILKLQNITNLYAGAADPMEEEDPYLTETASIFMRRSATSRLPATTAVAASSADGTTSFGWRRLPTSTVFLRRQ